MFFLWRGWDREVPVVPGGWITVSSFDVRVFAIRRRPGRETFEVRWRVAGPDRSRSFMSRALADGYRAELVRAARNGLAFAPGTGGACTASAARTTPSASGSTTPSTRAPACRVTVRESERLYAPSAPPQTLSAICT